MINSLTLRKLVTTLSYVVAIILVLVPFHAFLTVWLASLFGHYTLFRLWKEFLLVLLIIGAKYILWTDRSLMKRLISLRITQLILAYSLLLLVMAFVPYARHEVSAKAMWYGLLVDLRFLIFFLVVLVIAAKSGWLAQSWPKLLFAPAILVAAIAVLQYLVLPYDFLKHFGYNDSTIPPYETINHNIHHIRVLSTLRGANPLGAYLILPICALAVMFFRERSERRDKSLFGGGLLLALAFSFSRSAWLGAALGVIIIAWASLKSGKSKRIAQWVAVAIVVVGALAAIFLRNNLSFEDVFLHTNHSSTIATTSNENHSAAAKSALKDIAHHPLGRGVGTAGPQSIYNNDQGRIAENYFLQIGQEAGVIGILLFIAICVSVGQMLYVRRADPLALALLASLVGLSLVNLLSHAWSDDTLAYIWWGLAAVALAPILTDRLNAHGKNHKA